MTSRLHTASWLVAAAVLSSWAVSSASDTSEGRRLPPAAPRAARVVSLPDASVELDAEISRLRAHMAVTVEIALTERDPFSLAGRRPRPVRATAVRTLTPPDAPVVEPAPEAAVLPALSGIAEISAGAFTAVLSFGGELHFVTVGDVIAGRYRVDAVTLEGADIFDLADGTISRLRLQG